MCGNIEACGGMTRTSTSHDEINAESDGTSVSGMRFGRKTRFSMLNAYFSGTIRKIVVG